MNGTDSTHRNFASSIDEVEPQGDLLLIEVFNPTQTKGGIALPEGAQQDGPPRGQVVKTGPGLMRADGTHQPMNCKVGDYVYLSFSRQTVGMQIGEKKYTLAADEAVVMKWIPKGGVA